MSSEEEEVIQITKYAKDVLDPIVKPMLETVLRQRPADVVKVCLWATRSS